ncbi:MAG: SDR family NAD(P)-dependent oxidoreductase [Bacteroidales bacterium]
MPKIAFISGATSGIGEATAIKFAQNQFDLIITGRRGDKLKLLATRLNTETGSKVLPLVFDVRKRAEVENAVNSLPAEWKKIDVLVNNAGLALGLDPISEGNIDYWDNMIDTNVKGLLYLTRAISPLMIEAGCGHIVNIGSVAGREVYPNGNVYCASKYAVDALTKGTRMDLLKYGIKVTQVAPGAVETEFAEVRFAGDKFRAENVYKGYVPLLAEDIAGVIWYVASLPPHVNINDILVMPTAQASTTQLYKTV